MNKIEHAGRVWDKDYIKSYKNEDLFIAQFSMIEEQNSLRKLWKIVHGKTVPNYEIKESKPKRKRLKADTKAKKGKSKS